MSNLEHIKELLYTGQRSAISTKDFESIIEQLETSQSRVKELEEENKNLIQKITTLYPFETDYKKLNDSLYKRLKEMEEYIKTIFSALIIANHKDIGAIQDTIWVNKITTLWDYIRIVLNMDDNQFEEFEKQALKQMDEVKNV